jgi:hypothetical protein
MVCSVTYVSRSLSHRFTSCSINRRLICAYIVPVYELSGVPDLLKLR